MARQTKAMKTKALSRRLAAVCLPIGVGVLLGVVVLEISVRVFFPVSDFFWQFDPAIGLKLIPGKKGRAVKSGVFDSRVEVNSVGFRDREHALLKPADARRVVLLGDSFLEAIQVPFDSSVPPLLENRLQGRTGPTELINLSVSGTGTAREYLALRKYGLLYKPDLVLLFFVANDVSDNSKRLQGLPYLPYPRTTPSGDLARDESGRPLFTPFADQNSRLSSVTSLFRNHSKAYRFVREAIDNSPGLNGLLYSLKLVSTPPETVNAPASDNFGFYEIYRVEPKPAWEEAWRLTEQMMLATRDLAFANDAKFGVVLIPAFWEVDSGRWNEALMQLPLMRTAQLDLELPSKRLTHFLTAHNIPVIDLLPEFRARASSMPPLYISNDAHWTADGHKLAADLLTRPVAALLAPDTQALASSQ
jgi:lysophospholipase L1-like esterase